MGEGEANAARSRHCVDDDYVPKAVLDSLSPGLAVYDVNGRLLHATSRLKSLFPELADALRPGAFFYDLAERAARSGLFHGDTNDTAACRLMLLEQAPVAVEVPLTDGRWMLMEVSPVEGGGHTVSYTDITMFRQRQQDLEAREDRLALAMKASREGIWDWDVTANTVYFSPRWKETLGYADDELENSWETWRILLYDEDRAPFEARIQAVLKPPSDVPNPDAYGFEMEFRMRHRDGSFRRIRSRIHVSRDDDGRARRIVGTHYDVTPLRTAQERTARMAARLAEGERIAGLGSWECDAFGHVEWSPGLYALLDLPVDTLPSREAMRDRVHPDDQAALDICLERGGCIIRLVQGNGTVREVVCSVRTETDAAGAITRTIGAWLDVSLLRAVEDRAARAEVHLLSAIETVADGVILLDPEQRVVLVNSRFMDDFPGTEPYLNPGQPFSGFLRHIQAGGIVQCIDGMSGAKDWVTPRLKTLGQRTEPLEVQLKDGRWFLVKETRTADDYILIVRSDITALKRRETDLLESQARFQAMFDNSVQFIGLLSCDGTLLKVNRTAMRFIDGDERAVVGRPFWLTPWWTHDAAGQARLKVALTAAAGGKADRFETTHQDAAGHEHVVDVSVTPVFGPNDRVIHLIAEGRDLTAQREAEVALRRNAGFVQALGDTAQTPIYAHDTQGRYVFCNSAFALAVGRPQADIPGESIFHIALREHDVNMHEINRDLLNAGGSITYETPVTLADGTVRDMIVTKSTFGCDPAGPEGIVTVLTDISRQKEVERRFTDFARSSADWFWEMDRLGRFTYVSDRISEETDLRASELIGKRSEELIDESWQPEAQRAFRASLRKRQPVRDFTYRTVPINGRAHYVRITAVPAYDVNGAFIGFRGTGSEVTSEVEAASALRAAKEAAEIASRTKTEFLAAMSHELRTPLNAIIGFSEVMHMQALGPLGSEIYLEYAHDIRKSGEHLLAMVNDVLDASRLEIGKLTLHEEDVDMVPLVDAAIHLVRQRADDAGVRLRADVRPGVPRIRADGGRLKKVLTSLLSNGIKFTPEGGSVTVVVDMADDGRLEVSVRDTGIGMSNEQVEQALQRFTQLDGSLSRRYEGIGLGLTLARDIVELHGGALGIEGLEGRGTTVTFMLPAQRLLDDG